MIRIVPSLTLAAALLASPSLASAQAASGQVPNRIRSVTVAGDQKCPESTANEVVVCHRAEDPYRIPEELRDSGPIPAQNQSWAAKQNELERINRVAGGVPNSCSPVGTAGQTGCSTQALNNWYAEKRAKESGDGRVP